MYEIEVSDPLGCTVASFGVWGYPWGFPSVATSRHIHDSYYLVIAPLVSSPKESGCLGNSNSELCASFTIYIPEFSKLFRNLIFVSTEVYLHTYTDTHTLTLTLSHTDSEPTLTWSHHILSLVQSSEADIQQIKDCTNSKKLKMKTLAYVFEFKLMLCPSPELKATSSCLSNLG